MYAILGHYSKKYELDSSDGVYIVFMIIGIIGYFRQVPK